MPGPYKTPGVYIEEISTLPASVAQVATAVPAFIGYTAIADRFGESLTGKPHRITSLLEFMQFFGGGPEYQAESVTVVLDQNSAVMKVKKESQFYMFDSVQLYYDNGGGDAYVVSVGSYEDSIAYDPMLAGLEALRTKDEPTLIVFPDAVKIPDRISELQQQAIKQCAELQDRFAVFDLPEEPGNVAFNWNDHYQKFRDEVGINNLKYGAAYTPWVKVSYTKDTRLRHLKLERPEDNQIKLSALSSDAAIGFRIQALGFAGDDYTAVRKDVKDLLAVTTTLGADSAAENLAEHYQRLEDRAKGGDTLAVFEPLITFSREVAAVINKWPFNRTGNAKSTSSSVAVANEINDPPKDSLPVEEEAARQIRAILSARTAADAGPIRRLMAYHLAAETAALAGGPGTEYDEFNDAAFTGTSPWDIDATPPVADATVFNDADNNPAADDAERVANALAPLRAVFGAFNAAVADIIAASNDLEKTAETSVAELFGTYKNIIAGVNRELSPMPPSGAVVGAYAAVDDARGVWKAPANVSLNSVKDLTRNITADEQENLNVDTVAGKSINAIRPFTGKGILIWGARTLAGNDNEWRYVPVRRLYNMVEESVQKATSPVVFEPNDANTWTKVKTMIDNFLTRLWRDGALAGSKPEQAFFVRIGLGKTMTAIDILEGRLIIEIGLAAVRPAEFIILKFMHKLQEA